MPFVSTRPSLCLNADETRDLMTIARSHTEAARRIERARILLAFVGGETVSAIARSLHVDRPKVERCLDKAVQLGVAAALGDLPGRGRKSILTPEARAWVLSLACQKPKDVGYSYELWTTRLLAEHVRKHCLAAGHPSLARLGRGTVSKLLTKAKIRPHKINYYLERRDPEFDTKMAQVLYVYREVQILRLSQEDVSGVVAVLSFDEKPGIQAIGNTAPDLPPRPGEHATWSRDHEYVRHGTQTLMAGLDLLTGHVHGLVVDRGRSREFIDFLRLLDQRYPTTAKIRLVLDNHSAHISKETRAFLATTPNRFEFIHTPKHGSWLNLVESFFGKMANTMLRGIRVASKAELKERIEKFLAEVNSAPVIYRWTYDPESLRVV